MIADRRIRLIPNDELGALITAFLDDLALANRSPGTIRFYRGNLDRFRWWCEEFSVPLDPAAIGTADMRQFLRYVQTADVRWNRPDIHMASKPSTANLVHVYFRSLRPFFNWLVEQEVIDVSPMAKLKAPRQRIEQPDPFTNDELERLVAVLRAAGDGELAERDRAIVAVLLDVGLRASEISALYVSDIDHATGDLMVRSGKGDKARQLRIGARARRATRRYWMRHRRRRGEPGEDGPLFLTVHGRSLTPNSLKLMLERAGTKAGVSPVNPHRFRHSAAVNAVRAGMPLFQLQMMLGHTTLEMTRKYVKLVEADIVRANQEHSALDHLKLSL